MGYAHYLIGNNDTATVKESIWPLISRDLGYVVNNWNKTGTVATNSTRIVMDRHPNQRNRV